jgi:four helix bundle protein
MGNEELKQRTKEFALKVLGLSDGLFPTTGNIVIKNQLTRSATGMAANYRAAGKARSPKEFISKLGLVIEEADESWFWLDLLVELNKGNQQIVTLRKEADELTAIFTASIKTFKKNQPLTS